MSVESQNYWSTEAPTWVNPSQHPIVRGYEKKEYYALRKTKVTEAIVQVLTGSGPRVLDLGSGSGGIALYAPSSLLEGRSVISGDYSLGMLGHNPNHLKVQMDAQNSLPFATGSLDVVISLFLMRYLSEKRQQQLLHYIVRVLSPNGKALIIDHETIGHQYELGWFQPWSLITPFQTTMDRRQLLEPLASDERLSPHHSDLGELSALTLVKKG